MSSILYIMKSERVRNSVRELRTKLGLTQVQLAELVGVARQSIISIEKEHFLPTIETALRISTALGVPVDRIFWLEVKNK
jgi:DNA-binding XRE family transcriptional regulator